MGAHGGDFLPSYHPPTGRVLPPSVVKRTVDEVVTHVHLPFSGQVNLSALTQDSFQRSNANAHTAKS